jgi:hypothetical protein
MSVSQLEKLNGLMLGKYSLDLTRIDQMRMSGWRNFSLHLHDSSGSASIEPIINGIYSKGGKGVQPWIEVACYNTTLEFENEQNVDISEEGLEVLLFSNLHDILEPGSHIMLWYEGESGRETENALSKMVPPLITPLGSLLFRAGFISVRNFHLPEGGHEGGRKLWAERPLNNLADEEFRLKSFRDAAHYFLKPVREDLLEIEQGARECALKIFERLDVPDEHPEFFDRLNDMYNDIKDGIYPGKEA